MAVVAHEDDSILFMNPDLVHDIQAGRCVRTVFVTAGNAGEGESYWSSREHGAEAALADMAGTADAWTQTDARIAGHPMPLVTLSGNPKVSIVFMRLPDGSPDGTGYPANNYESLQKLYTGEIPQITAVDGSSSYTKAGLTSVLTALMEAFAPDRIDTQDFVGAFGDGDHSDHHAVAYFTRDAHRAYSTVAHTLVGYMDYLTEYQAANVTGSDLTQKLNAFLAYAAYDPGVCQTAAACEQNSYWPFLSAQYTVGAEAGGPGITFPPMAAAGADQMVAVSSPVELDGSGSEDPNGSPDFQWTQISGPPVSLSSTTAVQPTFTAPASATSLTFELVVTDGQLISKPSYVSIQVTPLSADLAPEATVTASSQNTTTGQLATKAVDGVVAGYPGAVTHEWATVGGKAGSWLKLAWNSAQTIDTVVLYDRPNLEDQITGATLTFSNGTSIAVPALSNGGTAVTVTFPAVSTTSLLLTITSVSATTINVGLAEIQVFPVGTASPLPIADAGPDQTVAAASPVQLDGSDSYDPGDATNFQWTQTGGPSVALSSAAAAQPAFTAPAGAATLTFQLVVTDGQFTSTPSNVTITVTPASADVAPLATVTASSQNTATGQLAIKAVDGVAAGYPGASTHEWATVGGVAGSWLNLAWTSPQTISRVVLYDRPNLNDQITSATLTFSNGVSVAVPALNNNGTATTVTFPSVTTSSLLMSVVAVSWSTMNVGLAEIQVFPTKLSN